MVKRFAVKAGFVLGALLIPPLSGRVAGEVPGRAGGAPETVALEEIVVTAGRIEESPETVGSSYTVVTREDIERSQARFLREALQGVPGLNLASDGAFGGRTSLFLRGANNNHTALMINGVRVYDPASTNAAFDFSLLPAEGLERVEIVRGPQGTLYGSDAIGGAVNVITRRGDGPPRLTASLSGGSHGVFQPAVNLRGRRGALAWDLSASFLDTDGISRFAGGAPDPYRRAGLAGGLSWAAADNLELGLDIHSWHARFDLDGFGADDPDYAGDNRFQFAAAYAEHLVNERWLHRLTLARQKNLRHTVNDPDPANPEFERTRYEGDLTTLDWQHTVFTGQYYTVVAGYARLEEKSAATEDFGFGATGISGLETNTDAVYVENRFRAGPLAVTLGGRADRHSIFGSHATWRATTAWRLPADTRLHASYGTGFKAPSLYQLFAPATAWGPIGNPVLEPETSTGWDVGLARTVTGENGSLALDATYFETRLRDLIDFDFLLGYVNVARAATSGFEYSARAEAGPFFGRLAYTRLNAFNKTAGTPLLRRPKHTWHLQAGWRFADRATVSLALNRAEKRYDTEWPVVFRMDDYTTCDLLLDYRLNQDTRLFARAANLFDEDYQEVFRYETEGRGFYFGVSRTW